jgi:hypothetical protein
VNTPGAVTGTAFPVVVTDICSCCGGVLTICGIENFILLVDINCTVLKST